MSVVYDYALRSKYQSLRSTMLILLQLLETLPIGMTKGSCHKLVPSRTIVEQVKGFDVSNLWVYQQDTLCNSDIININNQNSKQKQPPHYLHVLYYLLPLFHWICSIFHFDPSHLICIISIFKQRLMAHHFLLISSIHFNSLLISFTQFILSLHL